MFFGILSTVSGILALLLLVMAIRTLFKRTRFWWLLRTLSAGLLLTVALLLGLVSWDMKNYQTLLEDKPLASLSFEKVGEQAYIATLNYVKGGVTKEFYLRGDQWQIDARILRWKGMMNRLGSKPGYRMDRLSGRYFHVDDERTRERTVYSLIEQEYGLDFWALAHQSKRDLPIVEASYGSAAFLPMADGALFEVALSGSGLVAKPVNSIAKKATQQWLN